MIKLNVNFFNLKYTVECGQCFRWKEENGVYIGILKDRVIKVRQVGDTIEIRSNNEEGLEELVRRYFALDEDYENIEKEIAKIDEHVLKAVNNTSGLRFLRQDFFETLISYIISANNNIPRISKSVNEISRRYGREVELDNEKYYLFPTPRELKDVTEKEYRECGVGFRDAYIFDTVKKINSGEIDIEKMQSMDTKSLKAELLKLKGVGPKVADCILLFSCSRKEVFPIDTWVEKVMKKLYFNNREVSKKEIQKYADEHFGKNAGIVQQHLFYNIRENNI